VLPPGVPGFTATSLLGTGGFGSVWEATDAGGTAVAIKVSHAADPDTCQQLEREATILARVGAPHVPLLRGSGTLPDGRPYLVMELLSGSTLADEMQRWPAVLSMTRVRELGGALLESAAALHARGIVHRDLKPENVFLVSSGPGQPHATLMDFGFSHSTDPVPALAESVSVAGAGSAEYMAPEQITGTEVDARADVYALGLLLFEMVTLRLPFVGDRRELAYAHLSFRPPRPSDFADVPASLEEVIMRCLAKDPAARFSDAGRLREAFTQALSNLPGSANGPAARPSAARAGTGAMVLGAVERHKMVLVFAQGPRVSGVATQARLPPFGGQVAHAQPGLAVYAFTHRASSSPGQRALAAARALLAAGLAERLIVDLGEVTVKSRPSGSRLFGPVFTEATRYPAAGDPPGIMLAAAACALYPSEPRAPVPGRPGYFALAASAAGASALPIAASQHAPAALVGRSELLRVLLGEAARALADRRPRVASVLGEPGLGKTRVARELGRLLATQMPEAELIELVAREPGGSSADDPLAELLRRALELPLLPRSEGGHVLVDQGLGALARETHVSAALLLGWIAPHHPAVAALRAAPGVLRANMARAGFEALRHLASRRPVLVLLDDAHWADDTLLDALEQATASELPLWVCAFGRPVFADARPTWGQRAAHVHIERLGPLDRESAAELCRLLLQPAARVPEPVIARLTDRAEGVPLLLCELVRELRGEGLVQEQTGGSWCVATEVLDELPSSPLGDWIAGRELDQLPPDLAAHARLLSLLSARITTDEVNGVLRGMERDLADAFLMDTRVAIERLQQRGLLVQHRAEGFGFRNTMLREGVARTVGEALANRIHRSALAFYRSAPLPEATRTSRLAWHAARAGERREAATAYLSLAESARERHNYLEADLLYTQALSHLDHAEEDGRLRALQGRGSMRYRLGRYQGSLEDLEQARALAVRGGDAATQADVMLDEAMALDWLFSWPRSRELAEKARDLVEGLEAPVLQARVLLALGRSFQRFNQDREAADLLREASRRAEAIGDEGYEVQVTAGLMLGFLLPFLGLLDEAEERLQGISRLCEAKGDELHLAALWINRGCLWIARNDRERFLEDHERGLAYARRMGSVPIERLTTGNIASFFLWRGELEAAEPFARRIVELDERYFDRDGFRPESSVLLARILWRKGEEEEAARLVAQIRAHQAVDRAEARPEQPLPTNEQMLLDMMALAVAGGGLEQWQVIVERARGVAQGQELIEVLETAGLAAHRRGDDPDARRWWQEALIAGERIPNAMSARIRQRLETLG
jgi:tetratricopeptide (TPR) repeat protein